MINRRQPQLISPEFVVETVDKIHVTFTLCLPIFVSYKRLVHRHMNLHGSAADWASRQIFSRNFHSLLMLPHCKYNLTVRIHLSVASSGALHILHVALNLKNRFPIKSCHRKMVVRVRSHHKMRFLLYQHI